MKRERKKEKERVRVRGGEEGVENIGLCYLGFRIATVRGIL
jgi:hypothetical protein